MSPPIPSGVTLAALARDEGDGSSRGSNDESEVSGSNLAEEMTVVRARENLYKQSGKMGLNGKKINWKFWVMIMALGADTYFLKEDSENSKNCFLLTDLLNPQDECMNCMSGPAFCPNTSTSINPST